MAWHGTICMSIERSFTVSHINYATKLLYLSKEINLYMVDWHFDSYYCDIKSSYLNTVTGLACGFFCYFETLL